MSWICLLRPDTAQVVNYEFEIKETAVKMDAIVTPFGYTVTASILILQIGFKQSNVNMFYWPSTIENIVRDSQLVNW